MFTISDKLFGGWCGNEGQGAGGSKSRLAGTSARMFPDTGPSVHASITVLTAQTDFYILKGNPAGETLRTPFRFSPGSLRPSRRPFRGSLLPKILKAASSILRSTLTGDFQCSQLRY